jgi:tetraether lipid synthase
MLLREELITQDVQHDLDRLGIAKNAREEQIRARAEKIRLQKENERMAQLYRQHILKEPAPETQALVQIETRKSPNAQEGVIASVSGD